MGAMPPDYALLLPTLILPLIGAGIGAFFGAYLKKKGENLATHEDINKLVEQVTAVTKATKEIEERISDRVWLKQRRWELQHQVIFDILEKITELEVALFNLMGMAPSLKGNDTLPEVLRTRAQKHAEYAAAFRAFSNSLNAVCVVCGAEVQKRFGDLQLAAYQISDLAMCPEFPSYFEMTERWIATVRELRGALRSELGIDQAVTTITPQSGGSSSTG
jgi:hypothetical protein